MKLPDILLNLRNIRESYSTQQLSRETIVSFFSLLRQELPAYIVETYFQHQSPPYCFYDFLSLLMMTHHSQYLDSRLGLFIETNAFLKQIEHFNLLYTLEQGMMVPENLQKNSNFVFISSDFEKQYPNAQSQYSIHLHFQTSQVYQKRTSLKLRTKTSATAGYSKLDDIKVDYRIVDDVVEISMAEQDLNSQLLEELFRVPDMKSGLKVDFTKSIYDLILSLNPDEAEVRVESYLEEVTDDFKLMLENILGIFLKHSNNELTRIAKMLLSSGGTSLSPSTKRNLLRQLFINAEHFSEGIFVILVLGFLNQCSILHANFFPILMLISRRILSSFFEVELEIYGLKIKLRIDDPKVKSLISYVIDSKSSISSSFAEIFAKNMKTNEQTFDELGALAGQLKNLEKGFIKEIERVYKGGELLEVVLESNRNLGRERGTSSSKTLNREQHILDPTTPQTKRFSQDDSISEPFIAPKDGQSSDGISSDQVISKRNFGDNEKFEKFKPLSEKTMLEKYSSAPLSKIEEAGNSEANFEGSKHPETHASHDKAELTFSKLKMNEERSEVIADVRISQLRVHSHVDADVKQNDSAKNLEEHRDSVNIKNPEVELKKSELVDFTDRKKSDDEQSREDMLDGNRRRQAAPSSRPSDSDSFAQPSFQLDQTLGSNNFLHQSFANLAAQQNDRQVFSHRENLTSSLPHDGLIRISQNKNERLSNSFAEKPARNSKDIFAEDQSSREQQWGEFTSSKDSKNFPPSSELDESRSVQNQEGFLTFDVRRGSNHENFIGYMNESSDKKSLSSFNNPFAKNDQILDISGTFTVQQTLEALSRFIVSKYLGRIMHRVSLKHSRASIKSTADEQRKINAQRFWRFFRIAVILKINLIRARKSLNEKRDTILVSEYKKRKAWRKLKTVFLFILRFKKLLLSRVDNKLKQKRKNLVKKRRFRKLVRLIILLMRNLHSIRLTNANSLQKANEQVERNSIEEKTEIQTEKNESSVYDETARKSQEIPFVPSIFRQSTFGKFEEELDKSENQVDDIFTPTNKIPQPEINESPQHDETITTHMDSYFEKPVKKTTKKRIRLKTLSKIVNVFLKLLQTARLKQRLMRRSISPRESRISFEIPSHEKRKSDLEDLLSFQKSLGVPKKSPEKRRMTVASPFNSGRNSIFDKSIVLSNRKQFLDYTLSVLSKYVVVKNLKTIEFSILMIEEDRLKRIAEREEREAKKVRSFESFAIFKNASNT